MEFDHYDYVPQIAGRQGDRRGQGSQESAKWKKKSSVLRAAVCTIIGRVRKTRSADHPILDLLARRWSTRAFADRSVDRENACQPLRSRTLGAFERERPAMELFGRDERRC